MASLGPGSNIGLKSMLSEYALRITFPMIYNELNNYVKRTKGQKQQKIIETK